MEIPRYWRLKAQRYRMEGSNCQICGQFTFPPRPVCPRCVAQPVQILGGSFPALTVGFSSLESRVGYRIIERITR